ncbi:prolyl oligopeptidase family serine peptidase [Pseudomonas sp. PDNC002]|uniref:alpha/beta hydrolase family protein n=1 Tax=Pseudomonas sp. PDNC002 TaxID=2811422 RepID=UPI001965B6F2|nr:prolyl oligopeptidase family serine peptidase [Pseudomonas sp. PDNC002]QRY79958.1 prolyl oligopeptidase family serine peptidase [Pseudomonas sp. PDNC002]
MSLNKQILVGLFTTGVLISSCLISPLGVAATLSADSNPKSNALAQARKAFATQVNLGHLSNDPVEVPPDPSLKLITYPSAVGKLPAYLSADPGDGKRHPAIIWITGGDANSIGDVWSQQPADNDQSASAYRAAGIITMYPSLRGGNSNPGHTEGFYGEVDDVIAAADFLAQQPYVDPQRIYLGGHSTGGVLTLLTAESSSRFRATFSFGPRAFGSGSPTFFSKVDLMKLAPQEIRLRAPILWLSSIKTPVFVIEGIEGMSYDLEQMRGASENPHVHFIRIAGADHFSGLGASNRVIARKVLEDTGPTSQISLSAEDIEKAMR